MFEHTKPNVVVLGDSNTVVFGPAWSRALARRGWSSDQVVLHGRSGTTPRHFLPKHHTLYKGSFGSLWTRRPSGRPALADVLSPATRLVIIGLGGNMVPRTADEPAVEALIDEILRRAPATRLLWRGPPPSTAGRDGTIARRSTRASRYRRNGLLKQLLAPLHFDFGPSVDPRAQRVYLDVLALHACGPTRWLPLGTGRDADLEAERKLVASLSGDRLARDEEAIRGPWKSFVRARDSMPSHVPRKAAADLVDIVATQGYLDVSRRALKLPLRAFVIDDKARLRQGPPGFKWIRGKHLAREQEVWLETWRGRYGKVLDVRTREVLGWTARANLSVKVR